MEEERNSNFQLINLNQKDQGLQFQGCQDFTKPKGNNENFEENLVNRMKGVKANLDLIEKHQSKEREREQLRAFILPRKQSLTAKKESLESKTNEINIESTLQLKDNGFFTCYDDSHFQNKGLPKLLIEENPLSEQMKHKNIFNQALLSDLNSTTSTKEASIKSATDCQKGPDLLFGAIQRIRPLQQGFSLFGGSDLPNPFNISLELPPLPNLDYINEQGHDPVEFNFFPHLRQHQTIKNSSSVISPKKQIQSPLKSPQKVSCLEFPLNNRRYAKRKLKDSQYEARFNSIWNLMPLVNEDLLEHNLKSECSLQKFWEDESIDLKLRDLRISECGLLTTLKAEEFQKEFNQATQPILQIQKESSFSEEFVVQKALLMLQGIPSQIFQLEEKTMAFILNPNFKVANYSLIQEDLQSTFSSLLEAGSYFLHLREFVDFFLSSIEIGAISQNFVLSIQDFLFFYQNSIIDIPRNVQKRRKEESEQLFLQNECFEQPNLTILELTIHANMLIKQIRLLASVCLTQKYMDSNKQVFNYNDEIATYNKKSLIQSYDKDLEQIYMKQWKQNFPKGAQLLTYLYKILLCCDTFSDLSTSDLLRKIFQKTVEPLLRMINSYIFTGDFDDPFSEFFISKIFRKRQTGESQFGFHQDDYIFMFTSEPELKVPIFLIDIVQTIFKAGSSLHLLKMKELFIEANVSHQQQEVECLKMYFDICSTCVRNSADNKLNFLFYQTSSIQKNMLEIIFEIASLKKKQEIRQKHYEEQTEKLQQIELQVQYQEAEFLNAQLKAREIARQEYQSQWEEKERKRIEQKQAAYFALKIENQKQLDQAAKLKAQRLQEKVEEREQYRKELKEYERKKATVKEELKKQYEQILQQNQRVADLRSEQVKEEEKVAIELQEAVVELKNAEQSSPETVKNAQMPIEDEEMKNEAGQIAPQANTIATIGSISDFVQSASEPSEKPLLQGQSYQVLQLEDINIETEPNIDAIIQNEAQLKLETIDIISSIIQHTLLAKVFQRIDEKKSIESKRKTWNKIRKEEKVKEIQQRRSNWQYQIPQESIRTKLNNIFTAYQESNATKQKIENTPLIFEKEVNEATNKLTYNVPLALAVNQCLVTVVKEQYKLINKCLIHMIFRRLRLLQHLDTLRHIFFCYSGDIISTFMQSIFNNDIESTLKDNSLAFINNQFEYTVKSTTQAVEKTGHQDSDIMKMFDISQYIQNNFEFQIINKKGVALSANANFFFTAFNMGENIRLIYKRKYPLDMVISDNCLEKYNAIFFFLLKLKRMSQILSSLWKYLGSNEFRKLPNHAQSKIRRVQLLRSKMQHFISVLEQYTQVEVIQATWSIFKANLGHQTVFEDLIKLHNEFLDSIKHQSVDIIHLQQIITLVRELNYTVRLHGTALARNDDPDSKEAFAQFCKIEELFNSYTQQFYTVVKKLAFQSGAGISSGSMGVGLTSLKQLVLLLDFNKFYDVRSQQVQRTQIQ